MLVSTEDGRLIKNGLDYLCLKRRAESLSGGEYQRVRLAGQIDSALMGVTYIVDEPSVGLYGTDIARIIALLEQSLKIFLIASKTPTYVWLDIAL